MKSPSISFILIEYFCLDDIKTCIKSINETVQDIHFEIIISSNSMYSFDVQQNIRNESSFPVWVFNSGNLGFAGGMNAGLALANGDFFIITNPDVKFFNKNIDKAINYLLSHKKVGIIGPQIIDSNGQLQDSCRYFMSPMGLFKRFFIRLFGNKDVLLEASLDYKEIQEIDWVIGAFMIIKREVIEKIGYFDENFFLYVEDMDFCKRVWDCGFEVIYYPTLCIEYKGDRKSVSTIISKRRPNKYLFLHLKSYVRFVRKHGIHPLRKHED